jgi:hypothetical protein
VLVQRVEHVSVLALGHDQQVVEQLLEGHLLERKGACVLKGGGERGGGGHDSGTHTLVRTYTCKNKNMHAMHVPKNTRKGLKRSSALSIDFYSPS